MTIITFDHVSLRLGSQTVLSDVSADIEAGEFIGVLGPNGAGKTTLMRAILGLLQPADGTLRVFGRLPERGNPNIGYLPQLRTVLPDLRIRGRDFIASSLSGERWGLPLASDDAYRSIDATLDAVDASELAGRPFAEMSGGERQRLLLAQALIGEPRLLLLDEPLISMDARRQEQSIELVRRVCRERKITVLFSAHELNQLLGTLDRVLYLGNGRAVLGSIDEIVTAPVLSRIYGTEIEVVRAGGHIFVMSHGRDVERADHQHDHDHNHTHHH
jgi:zinc/manganese transport system ATP-binding protein